MHALKAQQGKAETSDGKPIADLCSRFGFHSLPFTREIAVKDRFVHPVFDAALEPLVQTIAQRMSAAIIAPAGTGKTALLRALVDRLPAARYRTHYVKVANLSKRDMCREIATAVDARPAGSFPVLVRSLQEHFLAAADTDGLRPVLLVDDSHEIRPDVLGILRILTNFDMDSRLVVSFVLSGQPPLTRLLRRADLVDVAGRLAHIAQLAPLSRADTKRYIEHRCRVAGAKTIPFDADSLDASYEISRGNLRAIDHLARKALAVAHSHDHDCVDQNHVAEARKMLWP
jgi:general secretion pathway protein A